MDLKPSRVFYDHGMLVVGDVMGGSFEHPSLVHIRPLTMDFFDQIEKYIKEHHEGCQCKLVGAFNQALGLKKAAMMHLDEGKHYSREDWNDHFHEEDVIEVPLLHALSEFDPGLSHFAHKITKDHETFRKQVYWQPESLALHAALEDQAMLRLIRVMKFLVQRSAIQKSA